MKLQCDVEVVNRLLPSFGVRSKGRGSRAVLSIGKHVDKNTQRLKENIEKFFTCFVEEGKATVRLKEPMVDICMSKADTTSLKTFLSAAQLAHRGTVKDNVSLSTLAPVHAKDVEKPKKKLTIMSKKDYPLTCSFPYTLEQLQVSYCKLARVDMRMLCLKSLRTLDLSNNHIKKLPDTIGDLRFLTELNLHNNHLESFGNALCLSSLQESLQHLDLSRNCLKLLPSCFCKLRELISLKMDSNEIVQLPFHISQLSKMRFLSVAHNKITVLPEDFQKLSLENLDLFGNPFAQPNPFDHNIQLTLPLTLEELASRAVLNYRIPYGPQLISFQLCGDMELAKICSCGCICVNSYIQTSVSINLHLVSHTVVLVDDMGGTEAPIQRHFCSLTCYCQFLDGCVQRGLN
ncbi:Leucine-rich repeat protein 1 [Bagarius yarrelli]|uniref:Leucine-rich repeat protein 1 n=1 Tax=Bagarius yarrelli TaxID=175774 RepID=A0A556V659_BAGYA|nr:Leucine-rich repeat protein 1 [Bagarius yarrelli]